MTAPQAPATPLPWDVFEHRDHSGINIGPRYTEHCFTDGEVKIVCGMCSSTGSYPYSMSKKQKKDAAYIDAACNAYPHLLAERAELVGALDRVVTAVKDAQRYGSDDDHTEASEAMDDARALLARLGE